MLVEIITLLSTLIIAVYFDFSKERIPNLLIAVSFLLLVLEKIICEEGPVDLIAASLPVFIPIIILFPFFAFGFVGAGDLKLFSLVGLVFGIGHSLSILWVSVIIAAIIGLVKIIKYKSIKERFTYLFTYIKETEMRCRVNTDSLFDDPYMDGMDEKMLKKCSIHFSLPILLGTILITSIKLWG